MVKKRIFYLLVLITLLIGLTFTQTTLKAATGDWQLVWSDEFTGPDGSAIDNSKWTFGSNNYTDSEVTYYSSTTANCYIQNNMCIIKGMKQNIGGFQYSSAKIRTVGKYDFAYGKLEMLAKLPYGQGICSNFWLVGSDIVSAGWPYCGEIDVMNNYRNELSSIHGWIYGPGYTNGISIAAYTLSNGAQFKDGFHLFSVEWEPNIIRWYCDGVLFQTITPANLGGNPWLFDHNFFLNIEMPIGGNLFIGNPDGTSIFPQYYTIDYVRVYQREGGYATPFSTPTPTRTPTPTPVMTLLSQGKTAIASSYQAGNEVYKGNDGNTSTRWSASGSAFPQWWEVDLGACKNLKKVDVDWYCSSNRAYKYKIEVSNDNINFITVIDKTGNTSYGNTSDNFSSAGRYLKITITGSNTGWASFYECRVNGY